MSESNVHLEIDRSAHSTTRLVDAPLGDLESGQVRFRIDRFAVTSNNVTYAAVGDALGYWEFFPCEAGWGRVPAMGWGEVVASAHPEVPGGGRYYGWFPMSRYLDLQASPTSEGLRDDGGHRAAHAPVYRTYVASERDPFYEAGADAEDRHALLRGLFLTAFLGDDFLEEHDYYGASRVVLLSASSKTAIGFAQRASARGLEVVGITSPHNVEFVAKLGWVDQVVPYDALETLPADRAAVSVDLSGDGAVLERLHSHLGSQLRYSMAVGLSHPDASPPTPDLPGPRPEFFFAPAQVKKRIEDWGPEAYRERVAQALQDFVHASRSWLDVTRCHGPPAAASTWDDVLAGRVPPSEGRIVSLWESP